MRVGHDLRPFLKLETGVGVYLRGLLEALAAADADNEYVLFSASWKDRFPRDRVPPFAKLRFVDLKIPVRALNYLWYSWRWPSLDALAGVRLDLAHSPTPLRLPTRGKSIATVCDLFFLESPGLADREARRYFSVRAERDLRAADGIVTISEFSRSALLERFGLDESKVLVTPLGLKSEFLDRPAPVEVEGVRKALGLASDFLLFVGATEPRKNLPGLIRALAVLHGRGERIPLVIAGRPGGDDESVRREVAASGLEPSVRFAGYVGDLELRALYHAASALVFPSFCEGFGLPLLEAMACGLPAAAARGSALEEIGGSAAVYFDPRNPEEMAEAVSRILGDAELRARLRGRGFERARAFRWDRTAALTLGFYEAVAGRG